MTNSCKSEMVGELAPKVLAVLNYLIQRPRKVVSADELIAAAWRSDEHMPKRVAHYIAQARRAIGDDGRDPRAIRTIYGVGYQYIGPSNLQVTAKSS